jgi:hypothetical protein
VLACRGKRNTGPDRMAEESEQAATGGQANPPAFGKRRLTNQGYDGRALGVTRARQDHPAVRRPGRGRGTTAYAQVELNTWNKPFYDALAHKNISVFIEQLWVFGELAGFLLILNVTQTWLNQKSKLVLRKGLIDDLMTQWLLPLRGFACRMPEQSPKTPISVSTRTPSI